MNGLSTKCVVSAVRTVSELVQPRMSMVLEYHP
jgi:hypothetical protein